MAANDRSKKKNIHENHRERMRMRFDATGFEGWSDFEILEYMLYNVYTRQDTNPIAHSLLEYSGGSVVQLMNNTSNYAMSEHINGVGTKTVQYLRSIKLFMDYYRTMQITEERARLGEKSFNDMLKTLQLSDDYEEIAMICLDRAVRIKCIARVTSQSDSGYAVINLDKMLRIATQMRATNVVLVHNHPSGNMDISAEDIEMTAKVDDMLDGFGIFLADHYVVCGDKVKSIKLYAHQLKLEYDE